MTATIKADPRATTQAEQERVAGEIRAIITEDTLVEALETGYGPDRVRALVLMGHLTAGRTQDAIYAHSVLLTEVQRELVAYGAPDDDWDHCKLLELLCEYIEHDYRRWQDGEWQRL